MANKKISELTPKGSALSATDLLEVSVDAGGGTYTTASITGQEITDFASAGKQDTLVSGTNIKSVNGNSLLGSGNLVISGGSGGGVHCLTPPYSGRVYIPMINWGVLANTATTANVIRLILFIPAQDITVSSLSINVGTGGAATSRILVYSDVNGLPGDKLIESTDLSVATTGLKTFTTTYTFTAGTTYWVGTYHSGGFSTFNIPASNLLLVNLPTFPSNPYTGLTYSYTYGLAPASLSMFSPTTTNGTFPAIYFNI